MPNATRTSSPAGDSGESHPYDPKLVRHLTARLRALEAAAPLAVAVSGGGDSLALAHLAAAAASQLGIPLADIHTVTVDHGLRPGSAEEARRVGDRMRAAGLSHDILHWAGTASGPGLQASARRARYGLMAEWAVRRGVRTLLTAHTADDQAETLLMRLARGSGVDGLAGMAPARRIETEDGTRLRLLRPLLEVPRARLREYLEARGMNWVEDPANENPAFDRVKARHALRLLAPLGLNRERLVKTAAQMARAREALEHAADSAQARMLSVHEAGFAWFDPAPLSELSRETALRVLARALMAVSGDVYRPRLDRLERALGALASGTPEKGRTLGGCRLIPRKDGRVLICRELRAAAAAVPLAPGSVAIWDGRFRVRLAPGARGGRVGPLGPEGLRQLRTRPGFEAAAIPPPARTALPGFFRDGEPLAAPHLGVGLPGLEVERLAGDGAVLRFLDPVSTWRA